MFSVVLCFLEIIVNKINSCNTWYWMQWIIHLELDTLFKTILLYLCY